MGAGEFSWADLFRETRGAREAIIKGDTRTFTPWNGRGKVGQWYYETEPSDYRLGQ